MTMLRTNNYKELEIAEKNNDRKINNIDIHKNTINYSVDNQKIETTDYSINKDDDNKKEPVTMQKIE